MWHARDDPFEILKSDGSCRARKSRKGLYDPQLVIDEGEKILQRLDDYAIKILRKRPSRSSYFRDEHGFIARDDEGPICYLIEDFDYTKLKLFSVSVLWRFCTTSMKQYAFKGYDDDQRLREMIMTGNPGDAEQLSVMLVRYSDDLGKITVLPERISLCGQVFARMMFGSFSVYIKLDDANTIESLRGHQLTPHVPWPVMISRFDKSKYYAKALETVAKTSRNFPERHGAGKA